MLRKTTWFVLALIALCSASNLPAAAQMLRDQAAPSAPSAEVQERARRIVAALEKIGLHPKLVPLPQAVDGYRIEATSGKKGPGGTLTELWVHVGSEAKISVFYGTQTLEKSDSYKVAEGQWKLLPSAPTPLWRCQLAQWTEKHTGWEWSFGEGRGEDYSAGFGIANCMKPGVATTVRVIRWESQPNKQYLKGPDGLPLPDYFARWAAHSLALANAVNPQVESWMNRLVKLVDDADKAGGEAVAAKPPEPKPSSPPTLPPRAPAKPPTSTTIPLPSDSTRAARDIFAPPQTVIGGRAERWWTNKREDIENYAAEHPNRWAGDCYMASGGMITALGVFVPGPGWILFGASMFTAGVALYHSDRSTPPAELPAVREARERIQRYQEEWKRGFTDAELNELGIFMDDLSKLTREQRQQVYRDSDIDFTSRAEFYRQQREAEAQERKGAGR